MLAYKHTEVTSVVTVRHWLPIVTICPVNKLPDLVYVSVTFTDDKLHELYQVRRLLKKGMFLKHAFMEDIANELFSRFPDACSLSLRLAFNRHEITLHRVP